MGYFSPLFAQIGLEILLSSGIVAILDWMSVCWFKKPDYSKLTDE